MENLHVGKSLKISILDINLFFSFLFLNEQKKLTEFPFSNCNFTPFLKNLRLQTAFLSLN